MPDIAFNLTWKIKSWFFDSPRVMAMMTDRTREALARGAALVGLIAQRSMRYRSPKSVAYAAPGSPPKAVSNHPYLRRFIQFAYDPGRGSAVVGPLLLPGSRSPYKVGPLHEFGGTVTVQNPRRQPIKIGDVRPIRLLERGGKGVFRVAPRMTGRIAAAGKTVPVALARMRTAAQVARAEALAETLYGPARYAATYPERKFMGPALERAAPQITKFWAESVRARAG